MEKSKDEKIKAIVSMIQRKLGDKVTKRGDEYRFAGRCPICQKSGTTYFNARTGVTKCTTPGCYRGKAYRYIIAFGLDDDATADEIDTIRSGLDAARATIDTLKGVDPLALPAGWKDGSQVKKPIFRCATDCRLVSQESIVPVPAGCTFRDWLWSLASATPEKAPFARS